MRNQGARGMKSFVATTIALGMMTTVSSPEPAWSAPSSDNGSTPTMAGNPFLRQSTLPYRLPPFDKVTDADYRPAFEAGMAEELREVAAIAHNPKAPDFENTIVALERTGRLLDRVSTVFDHLNQCNTNDEMQKIDTEM